ncbi:hypothetical protein DWU98_02335 [Dyella monticola]|uniref:YCII-related domain-containing protein n=1 Tax=Dyella monticola TaxID=1927958 RepID=A0A370X972_9GAMM|nr:YciI family protein [Dyella monticola]RDS84820.1 hypothetical protein DWU98_02335 [Dyella monticola]
MKRFLVMLMRRPQIDPDAIPLHKQFLATLREQGRNEMSGAFADQSGGAYLLRAESLEEALDIAHSDPAHTSGGWDVTVYEWNSH